MTHPAEKDVLEQRLRDALAAEGCTPDEIEEMVQAAHEQGRLMRAGRVIPPGTPRNYAEQRALLDDSLQNIPPFTGDAG